MATLRDKHCWQTLLTDTTNPQPKPFISSITTHIQKACWPVPEMIPVARNYKQPTKIYPKFCILGAWKNLLCRNMEISLFHLVLPMTTIHTLNCRGINAGEYLSDGLPAMQGATSFLYNTSRYSITSWHYHRLISIMNVHKYCFLDSSLIHQLHNSRKICHKTCNL